MNTIREHLRPAAANLGLDDNALDQIVDRITSGDVVLCAFSGWLASGKDTVAEAVYRQLGINADHHAFADLLKAEVNAMIRICGSSADPARASATIAHELDIDPVQADHLVHILWDETREDPDLNAYMRTVATRGACQWHGTQVRRAQNPNYWVAPAVEAAVRSVSAGNSAYFTDARFPNECDGLRAAGFTLIRLDISRETQRERLAGRGDPVPDDSVLFHDSEIALDDYEHFDLAVDNNGRFDRTVDEISKALAARRSTVAA